MLKIIAKGYTPQTLMELLPHIKNGDSAVLEMRCVYKIDDSNIVHVLPLMKFLECAPAYDAIKSFYVCQMV